MSLWQRIFGRGEAQERRSSGSGFTAEIMAARQSYIAGRSGLGELTATVQACVSLWEAAFAIAKVDGTDLLDRRTMAMLARSVALRGEALFLIREEGLVPCSDWDLSTRHGRPRAYRVSVSEAGGGRSETALAAEVLHLRIGTDPVAPWAGSAPLRRSALTAGLLQELETALTEIYAMAPLGSQVVPMPENPEVDNEQLGREFRGRRGRVLLRESVTVTAAGGPGPASDWRPADLTPDLGRSKATENLEAARGSICARLRRPARAAVGGDDGADGPGVPAPSRHLGAAADRRAARRGGDAEARRDGGDRRSDAAAGVRRRRLGAGRGRDRPGAGAGQGSRPLARGDASGLHRRRLEGSHGIGQSRPGFPDGVPREAGPVSREWENRDTLREGLPAAAGDGAAPEGRGAECAGGCRPGRAQGFWSGLIGSRRDGNFPTSLVTRRYRP